jgi:hypothetical protein
MLEQIYMKKDENYVSYFTYEHNRIVYLGQSDFYKCEFDMAYNGDIEKIVEIVSKSFKIYVKLERENQKLKRELKELKEHLKYMPDGEGYLEAKADFESRLE